MGKFLKGPCVLCQDIELSTRGCKTCVNMSQYRERNNKDMDSNPGEGKSPIDDEIVDIVFPGPVKVMRSPIYGNYVVASRTIEAEELIILERPMLVSAYGLSDKIPYCLSCYKDIALSSKCSKCRWPICGSNCENKRCHSSNECKIFCKAQLRFRGTVNEYFAVETLRCLLLRDNNPIKWNKILKFEFHHEARGSDSKAIEILKEIVNFIRIKCKLAHQFDEGIIDRVVGVLSVNTFWAFNDLQRYASCLFDNVTLFAHSCDPNTNRQLVEMLREGDDYFETDEEDYFTNDSGMGIAIQASRVIEKGEMITIRYVDLTLPVHERRAELKDTFYFDCTCDRCLRELLEDQLNINDDIVNNNGDDSISHKTDSTKTLI